ncbi:MAG: hypothetical protein P1P80_09760 [ANME-2 cluster archaeon]|nr:hypothetical protein [ANME-2 cluster archaeon]
MAIKTAAALENTRSYEFDMYSNITMLNEDIQIIKADGQVDIADKKMYQSMDYTDRTIQIIVIDDQTYYRETNGSWENEGLRNMEVWKDTLSEQRSILFNAKNSTMYEQEGGWILEVIPEKEEILEQMKTMGVETSGTELKSFFTRYWIEKGTFRIRTIETDVEVEIKFMGMQTPVRIYTVIQMDNYNKKFNIKAPNQLQQY